MSFKTYPKLGFAIEEWRALFSALPFCAFCAFLRP
jgi:hypothetical protein